MRHVTHRRSNARRRESGYALLMVIFMVASLVLLAAVATPRVLTEGRREKEAELVWRGKQYVRAVRLYYQKNGRYPQSLEDLSKPSLTGVHYLRKSYKDPTNSADGAWRLIYVSPSGQLIGSVNYISLQDMALKLGLGIAPGANSAAALGPQLTGLLGGALAGAASGPQPAAQQGGATPPGQTPSSGQQTQPGQPGQQAQQGQDAAQSASGFGQPTPVSQLQAVDGPVLGGFVVGVGSKVKKDSVQIYQGADSYAKWEFIWNQLTSGLGAGVATPGGAPGGITGAVQPTPGAPGASPATIGLPGSAGAGMGAGNPNPAPGQSTPQQ